ncbi:MAG: CPBP family intramembrane glutamic endopeptidase [Bacteroidia bacterium]
MRKIVRQLKDFLKEDFNLPVYGLTMLFLAITLFLNYAYDGVDKFVYLQQDGLGKLLRWCAFMGVPYFIVIGLQAIFQQPMPGLKKPGFWLMAVAGLLMICVTAWFPWHKTIARELFPRELLKWGILVLWNLKRFAFMLLPMLIYWLLVDRKENKFYGLFTKPKDLGPYFLMLGIMLVPILLASRTESFLEAYPQYYAGPAEAKVGVSPWLTGAAFEFVYGADFALVELAFRGFLVIGIARWIGPRAVLPMAAAYCFLHFGKPAGEAVSSFFGGYLLGLIAYYSRSIWGGIVVHMGVAWMMETAAYLQRTVF